MKAYSLHKQTVVDELRKAQSLIHLSFDMWTSRNLIALNGIVAHFHAADSSAKTLLLALPEHEDEHSGVNIAQSVGAIIRAFQIGDRIGYFILDNAANNDTALDELADQFGFVAKERRLRCMGHVINLIAKQLLFGENPELFELQATAAAAREVREAVQLWREKGPRGKLHNIVIWIYRSPQRKERFVRVQQQLLDENPVVFGDDEQRPQNLVLDNATRWNSTYSMIAKAVKLRLAIDEFIIQEKQRYERQIVTTWRDARRRGREVKPKTPLIIDDVLSATDWQVLTIYLDVLQPLHEVTIELQGRPGENKRNPAPISDVLISYEYLLDHLEQVKERYTDWPEPHLRWCVEFGWQKAKEYYELLDRSPVYVAAVVLHPKRKWQWIDEEWKDKLNWCTEARAALKKLWSQYRDTTVDSPPPRPEKELTGLAAWRNRHTLRDGAAVATADELAHWLEQVPVDEGCEDPIAYWKARRQAYPRLSRMALDIFTIPAMSSEPERVFSIAGIMVTDRRNRLKAETIQAAQCLRWWQKDGVIEL